MVYEGPMSDSSTAIYGLAELDERATTIFRDSRYGDFDDYLAFTQAEAQRGLGSPAKCRVLYSIRRTR